MGSSLVQAHPRPSVHLSILSESKETVHLNSGSGNQTNIIILSSFHWLVSTRGPSHSSSPTPCHSLGSTQRTIHCYNQSPCWPSTYNTLRENFPYATSSPSTSLAGGAGRTTITTTLNFFNNKSDETKLPISTLNAQDG